MGGPSDLVFSGGRARTCSCGAVIDHQLLVFEFYDDSTMTVRPIGARHGGMSLLPILSHRAAGTASDVSVFVAHLLRALGCAWYHVAVIFGQDSMMVFHIFSSM
jgi:hypothetical protein